ncbi:hypothetical protein C0993_007667 [Termitomyces sp. T159_Od127]|nr:hypothetical protein C0993_007667 [Termitomyces sp. T159_Od127]
MSNDLPSIPVRDIQKRPLYELSTQFRNWRFSPEHLAHLRFSLNAAAVSAIRHTLESEKPGSSAVVSFLTADEELLLVKLYVTKITQLCGHFRFPEEVEATAISYLKRFYLKNTVMDWHPKNVMCVYCEEITGVPTYLGPRRQMSSILNFWLRRAWDSNLQSGMLTEPYGALSWTCRSGILPQFIQSLTSAGKNYLGSLPDHRTLYESALTHVRASRLTDAELIYTPSQIALAAFALAAPDLAIQWANSKLRTDPTVPAVSIDTLFHQIDLLKSLIASVGHPPDVEAVREVDRRLKLCKNPEKIVGSTAYLAKKAEEDKKAEEKRNKKLVELTVEGKDPFHQETGKISLGLVDYDDDD